MTRLIPPLTVSLVDEESGELTDVWTSALRDHYFALGGDTGQLFIEDSDIKSENDTLHIGNGESTVYLGKYLWDNTAVQDYVLARTGETTLEWKSPDDIFNDYETGMVRWWSNIGSMPGWVLLDGGTVGGTNSSATNRASTDCESLFKLIWNQISDTYCPVIGGRGASADADWEAGKAITLPVPVGNTIGCAGSGSGLTAREIGESVGEDTHALTVAEEPDHFHSLGGIDKRVVSTPTEVSAIDLLLGETEGSYTDGTITQTITTSLEGSGDAHENRSPFMKSGAYIKL